MKVWNPPLPQTPLMQCVEPDSTRRAVWMVGLVGQVAIADKSEANTYSTSESEHGVGRLRRKPGNYVIRSARILSYYGIRLASCPHLLTSSTGRSTNGRRGLWRACAARDDILSLASREQLAPCMLTSCYSLTGRWIGGHVRRPALLPDRHYQDAPSVCPRVLQIGRIQWHIQGPRERCRGERTWRFVRRKSHSTG